MAESRYNINNNTKTSKSGNIVYKSLLYPVIQTSLDDVYVIVKETDRLDLLAYKYYGDVTKWWIIAHANHIKNTFYVETGTQIRIPANISQIQFDMEELNKDVA